MFTTLCGRVGVIKRNYKIILTIRQQHLDPDTEPTKCVKCSQLSETQKKKKNVATKMEWHGIPVAFYIYGYVGAATHVYAPHVYIHMSRLWAKLQQMGEKKSTGTAHWLH